MEEKVMATDVTTINGTALSDYGASLLSYNTGAVAFSGNYFKAGKRLRPTVFNPNMPLREVTIKCEFTGSTDAEAETNATNLVSALTGLSEIYLPDGYYYAGVISKIGKPNRIAAGIFTRDFVVVAYRHGAKETATLTGTGSITVKGNYKTAVKYTITVSSGTEFNINGVNIIGITGSVIVIDGIDATITEDGANCFDKSDMTAFPELSPGANTITITGTGTVVIEYYPIYY